jgi:hypothetical protein
MNKQRLTVDMPLLPSEISGLAAKWETKKVLAIISKRKKKAVKRDKNKKIYTLKAEDKKKLAAMPYKKYLRSKYWKMVKVLVLKKYKYRCKNCGSKDSLEAHHNKYVARGTEHLDLSVLTLLCSLCHMETHDIDISIYEPWGGRIGMQD